LQTCFKQIERFGFTKVQSYLFCYRPNCNKLFMHAPIITAKRRYSTNAQGYPKCPKYRNRRLCRCRVVVSAFAWPCTSSAGLSVVSQRCIRTDPAAVTESSTFDVWQPWPVFIAACLEWQTRCRMHHRSRAEVQMARDAMVVSQKYEEVLSAAQNQARFIAVAAPLSGDFLNAIGSLLVSIYRNEARWHLTAYYRLVASRCHKTSVHTYGVSVACS